MIKSKTAAKESSGHDRMQKQAQMHGKVVSAAAVARNNQPRQHEGKGGAPDDQSHSSNISDKISYCDKALLNYIGDLQLTLSVIRANDLVDKGTSLDAQDPMVRVTVGKETYLTERHKDAGNNASFSEKFTFTFSAADYRDGLEVKVEVLNKSMLGSETMLGSNAVPIKALLSILNDTEELRINLKERGHMVMKGKLVNLIDLPAAQLKPEQGKTDTVAAGTTEPHIINNVPATKSVGSSNCAPVEGEIPVTAAEAENETSTSNDKKTLPADEFQFYCDLCSMPFKSQAFLDRHVKFSDLHERNSKNKKDDNNDVILSVDTAAVAVVAVAAESKLEGKKKGEYLEGIHYKLLHTSEKFYWRTQSRIRFYFYHHFSSNCIEIVAFDCIKSTEVDEEEEEEDKNGSRLYMSYPKLKKLLTSEIMEKIEEIKGEKASTTSPKKSSSVALLLSSKDEIEEATYAVIGNFILHRLQKEQVGPLPISFSLSSTDKVDGGVSSLLLSTKPANLEPVVINFSISDRSNFGGIDEVISSFEANIKAVQDATTDATRLTNIVHSSVATFSRSKQATIEEEALSLHRKRWKRAIRKVIYRNSVAHFVNLLGRMNFKYFPIDNAFSHSGVDNVQPLFIDDNNDNNNNNNNNSESDAKSFNSNELIAESFAAIEKTERGEYDDKALLNYNGDLRLIVNVIKANDLVDKGTSLDAQDPMVRVTVGKETYLTERHKDAGNNASFIEIFSFTFSADNYRNGLELKIEVLNKSMLGIETTIGSTVVPIKTLLSKLNQIEQLKMPLREGGIVSMKGKLINRNAIPVVEPEEVNKINISSSTTSASAPVSSAAIKADKNEDEVNITKKNALDALDADLVKIENENKINCLPHEQVNVDINVDSEHSRKFHDLEESSTGRISLSPRDEDELDTLSFESVTHDIYIIDEAFLNYFGDLQLTLSVIRANDLVDKGTSLDAQDPMVRMTVGKETYLTERHKDAGNNASFSEKFTFTFSAADYRDGLEVKVEVLNKSMLGSETMLGSNAVPLKPLLYKLNDTDLIQIALLEGGYVSAKGKLVNLSPLPLPISSLDRDSRTATPAPMTPSAALDNDCGDYSNPNLNHYHPYSHPFALPINSTVGRYERRELVTASAAATAVENENELEANRLRIENENMKKTAAAADEIEGLKIENEKEKEAELIKLEAEEEKKKKKIQDEEISHNRQSSPTRPLEKKEKKVEKVRVENEKKNSESERKRIESSEKKVAALATETARKKAADEETEKFRLKNERLASIYHADRLREEAAVRKKEKVTENNDVKEEIERVNIENEKKKENEETEEIIIIPADAEEVLLGGIYCEKVEEKIVTFDVNSLINSEHISLQQEVAGHLFAHFKFKAGDKVDVYFEHADIWVAGLIELVHSNGTYDVNFEQEGSVECDVPEELVRFTATNGRVGDNSVAASIADNNNNKSDSNNINYSNNNSGCGLIELNEKHYHHDDPDHQNNEVAVASEVVSDWSQFPAFKGGWIEGLSSDNEVYYYNTVTGESSWTLPAGADPIESTAQQQQQEEDNYGGDNNNIYRNSNSNLSNLTGSNNDSKAEDQQNNQVRLVGKNDFIKEEDDNDNNDSSLAYAMARDILAEYGDFDQIAGTNSGSGQEESQDVEKKELLMMKKKEEKILKLSETLYKSKVATRLRRKAEGNNSNNDNESDKRESADFSKIAAAADSVDMKPPPSSTSTSILVNKLHQQPPGKQLNSTKKSLLTPLSSSSGSQTMKGPKYPKEFLLDRIFENARRLECSVMRLKLVEVESILENLGFDNLNLLSNFSFKLNAKNNFTNKNDVVEIPITDATTLAIAFTNYLRSKHKTAEGAAQFVFPQYKAELLLNQLRLLVEGPWLSGVRKLILKFCRTAPSNDSKSTGLPPSKWSSAFVQLFLRELEFGALLAPETESMSIGGDNAGGSKYQGPFEFLNLQSGDDLLEVKRSDLPEILDSSLKQYKFILYQSVLNLVNEQWKLGDRPFDAYPTDEPSYMQVVSDKDKEKENLRASTSKTNFSSKDNNYNTNNNNNNSIAKKDVNKEWGISKKAHLMEGGDEFFEVAPVQLLLSNWLAMNRAYGWKIPTALLTELACNISGLIGRFYIPAADSLKKHNASSDPEDNNNDNNNNVKVPNMIGGHWLSISLDFVGPEGGKILLGGIDLGADELKKIVVALNAASKIDLGGDSETTSSSLLRKKDLFTIFIPDSCLRKVALDSKKMKKYLSYEDAVVGKSVKIVDLDTLQRIYEQFDWWDVPSAEIIQQIAGKYGEIVSINDLEVSGRVGIHVLDSDVFDALPIEALRDHSDKIDRKATSGISTLLKLSSSRKEIENLPIKKKKKKLNNSSSSNNNNKSKKQQLKKDEEEKGLSTSKSTPDFTLKMRNDENSAENHQSTSNLNDVTVTDKNVAWNTNTSTANNRIAGDNNDGDDGDDDGGDLRNEMSTVVDDPENLDKIGLNVYDYYEKKHNRGGLNSSSRQVSDGKKPVPNSEQEQPPSVSIRPSSAPAAAVKPLVAIKIRNRSLNPVLPPGHIYSNSISTSHSFAHLLDKNDLYKNSSANKVKVKSKPAVKETEVDYSWIKAYNTSKNRNNVMPSLSAEEIHAISENAKIVEKFLAMLGSGQQTSNDDDKRANSKSNSNNNADTDNNNNNNSSSNNNSNNLKSTDNLGAISQRKPHASTGNLARPKSASTFGHNSENLRRFASLPLNPDELEMLGHKVLNMDLHSIPLAKSASAVNTRGGGGILNKSRKALSSSSSNHYMNDSIAFPGNNATNESSDREVEITDILRSLAAGMATSNNKLLNSDIKYSPTSPVKVRNNKINKTPPKLTSLEAASKKMMGVLGFGYSDWNPNPNPYLSAGQEEQPTGDDLRGLRNPNTSLNASAVAATTTSAQQQTVYNAYEAPINIPNRPMSASEKHHSSIVTAGKLYKANRLSEEFKESKQLEREIQKYAESSSNRLEIEGKMHIRDSGKAKNKALV